MVLTILKNMKVSWEGLFPYMMENKKCLKPPTTDLFGIGLRCSRDKLMGFSWTLMESDGILMGLDWDFNEL